MGTEKEKTKAQYCVLSSRARLRDRMRRVSLRPSRSEPSPSAYAMLFALVFGLQDEAVARARNESGEAGATQGNP